MTEVVSKTELARNTREIIDQVRHGQPILVRSYGQDQIVLMDAFDYRLLKAVANFAMSTNLSRPPDPFEDSVQRYLKQEISLAKAAELLSLSRFELMERFDRLGIPLRLGADALSELEAEIHAAQTAGE